MTDKKDWEKDFRLCFYLWDEKEDGSYVTCGEDVIEYVQSVIDQQVSIAVEEFAKKVEEEVIGEDDSWDIDSVISGNELREHKIVRNNFREKQRQALKLLVKGKKEL